MPLRSALIAVGVAAVFFAVPATAAEPTAPVYDGEGNLVDTPFAPRPEAPSLTEERAAALFAEHPKVASWLDRYPPDPDTDATFDNEERSWEVKVWSGQAGQIAEGVVDDRTGAVSEAWTGPQVAWRMARGHDGAFGGKTINRSLVWFGFVAVFLVGLVDWRRPLSLRTLDLVALVSFSASLWFFNAGDVFTAMPLVYLPLAYLVARLAWIGSRGRGPRGAVVWPVWLLAAAAVFLAGFRVALNYTDSNVIDVGYSGVIGAHRIATGEMPYGNMPVATGREPCGEPDDEGNIRDRIQTNGRCEHANEHGDTYGPVAYLAYLPGYWLLGWSGDWDDLPAAHFTAVAFDLLTLLGLVLVGLRFGARPLAAVLAFAWTAYPFTQYASSSNTNDALMPAFLVWGFWLVSSPGARGALVALSGWTKFASLIVAPLWATYPDRRPSLRFLAGFLAASLTAFAVLLLEPSPIEAARTFGERSLVWQIGRESPFSIWGWGQYHAAGIPDLDVPQRVLQALLVAAALAAAFLPRRKTPLQLAALTGALIAGFQLVQTHWFYLYLPWFFPFAALAVLARGDPD
ncbi:MAG: hypothetical protein ICV67_00850 [Thermoleophilia bacterium]|nr:hypothetical protein [Thermoleophilia bacterium]